MLGVGEFWIGVATRVVGVCRRTRGENGGFISVDEVRRILVAEDKRARRTDVVEISESAPPVPVSPSPIPSTRSIASLFQCVRSEITCYWLFDDENSYLGTT